MRDYPPDPDDYIDTCALCGEAITGDRAEMHDPEDPLNGGFVHPDCGISAGWELS